MPILQTQTTPPRPLPMLRKPVCKRAELRATLAILQELARASFTVAGLADHLGLHWRTVYRYLEAIRDSGVELARTRDPVTHAVYYRITADEMERLFGVRITAAAA